ncbi:MAG: EF-P beta-lysylation protein EpmB [Gammaproteobacteria bacterium]|nr:EF-P beta-lysylation protein EpmB [Gammaproteobacteria bacterium]
MTTSSIQHIDTSSILQSGKKALWQEIFGKSYMRPKDLLRDLGLPDADVSADALFATRVPRPFVEKMEYGNPNDPLLLQIMPSSDEFIKKSGFTTDPLAEQQYNPLPGLLHKYQSRVLLTLRGACAINCRYCFRRHFEYADNRIKKSDIDNILNYVQQHPKINEVILSGGDPLMATDTQIAELVSALSTIPQLKRLRFHTRLPVVIPERITPDFINVLSQSHLKAIVVLHTNHPREIDDNFCQHVKQLSTSGIQVLNQGVLLKNINDNADILAELSEKLFDANILPYYLFLLDKVSGTSHFEVSEKRAKQLIKDMAAQLPGYLVPKLTRETPGMASKDMWV